MIYLFLGNDFTRKDKRIHEIKEKVLTSKDASKFDYEILHSHKLDPDDLKKALITLPVIVQQRIVLVRSIEKLSPANKKIILKFLEEKEQFTILILDSDDPNLKTSFITKVSAKAKVEKYGQVYKQNVFDMTRSMSSGNAGDALGILKGLLEAGDHPLQIMGGLVWFWGKSKNRLRKDSFKKGLLVLQEADLNIKRTRLKPDQAVEVCVTQLCSIIAC